MRGSPSGRSPTLWSQDMYVSLGSPPIGHPRLQSALGAVPSSVAAGRRAARIRGANDRFDGLAAPNVPKRLGVELADRLTVDLQPGHRRLLHDFAPFERCRVLLLERWRSLKPLTLAC